MGISKYQSIHLLKSCGVYRSLGTHILKVLSVTLDEWSDEEVDSMIETGGNASANSIYEAFVPDTCSKPGPDVNHDQRMRFIRVYLWWMISET
ncbi:ARFGAP/RecO-like zinc finger [Arabidopsis thaliana x Arabidopsis arenosa]|nr:ARFGAP/RecO-like zinc finger [Arabidopsis thaliana x Arabidopsis arenosa]